MDDKKTEAGGSKDSIYISVIITAYDRREFLLNAIKSAIDQTLDKKHYEIIVIKNFKDESIENFTEKNNIKCIVSDEKWYADKIIEALNIAKGNVISFLDDDDLFTKDKLEVVYNKFKSNPNLVYYHNDIICVNDKYKKTNIILGMGYDFNMSSISARKNIINWSNIKKSTIWPDIFSYLSALESGKDMDIGKEKLTYYMYHNSWSNKVTANFNEFKSYSIDISLDATKSLIYFKRIFKSKKSISCIKGRLAEGEIIRYILKGDKKPDNPFDVFNDNASALNFKLKLFGDYILSRTSNKFRNFVMKKMYKNYINRLSKLEN